MFVFDLASFDNARLANEWRYGVVQGQSRVIVLEDLDSVFRGRVNIHFEGVTFDSLLQLIDGGWIASRQRGTSCATRSWPRPGPQLSN